MSGAKKSIYVDGSRFSRLVSKLLSVSDSRTSLLIRLLHETGMSCQDVTILKKEDLFLKEPKISIRREFGSYGKARVSLISKSLHRALLQHVSEKKPASFVFSSRQSASLSVRRVEQLLRKVSVMAQLKTPIKAKDFRNAYFSRATKIAKTSSTISSLTGLRSIGKKDILYKEHQKALFFALEKASLRDKVLVHLLLDAPLYASNLADLKVGKVQRGGIYVNDTFISLSSKVSLLLSEFVANKGVDEFIFSSRQSASLSVRRIEQILQSYAKKAGVAKLSSFTLRATAIDRIAQEEGSNAALSYFAFKGSLFYGHGIGLDEWGEGL